MSKKKPSRYFKSFSATTYPVKPLNELDLKDAQSLGTYYEATFDSRGRLCQFVKHLKERNANDQLVWKEMFAEEYTYYPSGQLKERKLTSDGGEPRIWRFEDKPPKWSEYLDAFFSNWFSQQHPGSADIPLVENLDVADRPVVCHELLNEIENSVFEAIAFSPRDQEWAFTNLTGHLPKFKAVVRLILPESDPRFVLFSGYPFSSDDEPSKDVDGLETTLEGFDEIGGVDLIVDLIEQNSTEQSARPQRVPLGMDMDIDADVRQWLEKERVASLFVIPIRAIHEQQLESVARLSLLLSGECSDRESAALGSILTRIGHFCQTTIELARANEPFEQRD